MLFVLATAGGISVLLRHLRIEAITREGSCLRCSSSFVRKISDGLKSPTQAEAQGGGAWQCDR